MQFLFHPAYRRVRLLGNAILFCLILALGAVPGARSMAGVVAPEFVLHAGMYVTLTLLLYTGGQGTPFKRSMSVLAIIAVMAAIDEGLQSLLPYREGSMGDWTIDVVAALGMIAMLQVAEKRIAVPQK